MDFVVVDVETANPKLSSICQIGIASFTNGELVDTWESLINPEDYFSPVNVSIHGIDESLVEYAPTWRVVFPEIRSRLQNTTVVSYTAFDRNAVAQACERSDMAGCGCTWLDSARVVRLAWPQFSYSGYRLSHVAEYFGIEYQAHDALEDARCAGLLLLRAIAETGIGLEQWLSRVERPIHSEWNGSSISQKQDTFKRDGNPQGRLFGEVIVFTGSLSVSRRYAADLAAASGCRVDDGVTKHTTMLVVGDKDVRTFLSGHEKSSKHRKAEHLITHGQQIRILCESDFMRIVTKFDA